jgi:hypothetical protein
MARRSRPVEGADGGDVLDAVGAKLAQRIAHALAFELEHPDGLARAHQLVAGLVVERQGGDVDGRAALLHVLQGAVDDRQGLQAEEVELHQAGALHPLHVELGGGQLRARVAVERGELGQRPVADHHARRVGRGVAVEALELQGDVQQPRHPLVAVALGLQAGLDLDGLGERHRIGGVGRHHLGEPVHLAERKLKDPADVSQNRARLQGAEGDDLGDPVAAVALLHVGDHLLAPLLAEVDVEVRHRDPLGIQEALEEQVVLQGVEVGDGQGIGDQGAGAGAAPRAHGDAARLRPLDEVRHDQEVAGETHLGDHPDLPLEPLLVVLGRRGVGLALGYAGLQPLARLVGQLVGLRAPALGREARQERIALVDHEGAAPGDIEGVVAGLRQVGEQRAHVGGRLEPVLGGDPAPLVLADEGAVGDAEQRIVRPVHRLGLEIDVVGGDQRHVLVVGEAHQLALRRRLGRQAVALQLDIEAVAEHPVHLGKRRTTLLRLSGRQQVVDRPIRTARQQDQPLGMLDHLRPGDVRVFRGLDLEVGDGGELGEIEVALLALGQEHHAGRLGPALRRLFADAGDRQGAADDRLHAGALGGDGELKRAEQVRPVGERHGRHMRGLGHVAQLVGLDGAFQQRIGGARAQVNEAVLGPLAQRGLPHSHGGSPHVSRHGADHPDKAGDRHKGQRFSSQANHVRRSCCGCSLNVLFPVLFSLSSSGDIILRVPARGGAEV